MSEDVLTALRRIVRAIDLHSRQLLRRTGLTGPQTLILKELMRRGEATVSILTAHMNLSQATVTDILNRLERRGLVVRTRSDQDRRVVRVLPTPAAAELVSGSPALLQETFLEKFESLREWEQFQLLASLVRVADMMDARELDASPLLSSGSIAEPSGLPDSEPGLGNLDPVPAPDSTRPT